MDAHAKDQTEHTHVNDAMQSGLTGSVFQQSGLQTCRTVGVRRHVNRDNPALLPEHSQPHITFVWLDVRGAVRALGTERRQREAPPAGYWLRALGPSISPTCGRILRSTDRAD